MPGKTVKIECPSCHATGITKAHHDGHVVAVVCLHCEGRGWIRHAYKEFESRKKIAGIEQIHMAHPSHKDTATILSYQEFEAKYLS